MVEVLASEPSFVPDVYFTKGYGQTDALSLNGTWVTIANPSGEWQMPVVLSDLEDGLREAVSPYGYAGIHIGEGVTAADATNEWDSACELLRGLGVVSLFLRFSPLDTNSVTVASRFDELTIRRSGTTYLVDIVDPSCMWDGMEGRSRTAIRKARKCGLIGSVRSFVAADVERGSDFRRLYEGTMLRVGASVRYSFDDAYFSELLDAPGVRLSIAEVSDGTEVVASSLVMQHKDRAHYHLSGSDPDASRHGANPLLVWSILEWCAGSGVKRCHLGGGRAEMDGLARFKRSFGGEAAGFHTGRAVIDAEAYSRLTKERADQLGSTVTRLEESGFFPTFRASLG